MLRSKDINKIAELKNGFNQSWLEPDFIKSSLKNFSFSSLCNCLNPLKRRGYGVELVLTILISMPFIGKTTVNSMYNKYIEKSAEMGKDVFYRLMNNSNVCWRLLLWLFVAQYKKIIDKKSQIQGEYRCMIFDDTVLKKTGRYIENISRVWDHVTNRYVLGFKMLLMGYWDGASFIPVDFSLHREKGTKKEKPYGLTKKELKKQYKYKRDKDCPAYERVQEADQSKIDLAIKMFKRAIGQGFKVDYVLMDSWFTCEAFIDAVLSVKKQAIHLIGMYKIASTKFVFKDQKLTHKQILSILGKSKRCRKLKLYYNEANVDYNGKKIKLCFSKQGKSGKWKVFICTDTTLSFVKMIEIYQTRWTIEVFFKEAKQLFHIGKCQANNFNAHIAETTITMIQHILVSLKYRFENYESKGALFESIKINNQDALLNQRLWGLFIELITIIEILYEEIDSEQLMEKILTNEQSYEIISRLLNFSDKKMTA